MCNVKRLIALKLLHHDDDLQKLTLWRMSLECLSCQIVFASWECKLRQQRKDKKSAIFDWYLTMTFTTDADIHNWWWCSQLMLTSTVDDSELKTCINILKWLIYCHILKEFIYQNQKSKIKKQISYKKNVLSYHCSIETLQWTIIAIS